MRKALYILLMISIATIAFAAGGLYQSSMTVNVQGVESQPTAIVTVDKSYPVYINVPGKTVYIDNAPIVLEKIVEKPVTLKDFESVDNLQAWALSHVAIFKVGIVDGNTITFIKDPNSNCVDYAQRFQQLAELDGYRMSLQVITNGTLDGVKVSSVNVPHMGNLVIVGNMLYFVEPQTGGCTFITFLK